MVSSASIHCGLSQRVSCGRGPRSESIDGAGSRQRAGVLTGDAGALTVDVVAKKLTGAAAPRCATSRWKNSSTTGCSTLPLPAPKQIIAGRLSRCSRDRMGWRRSSHHP
jgi:hypothetical protein